jgi:hypothetical protein
MHCIARLLSVLVAAASVDAAAAAASVACSEACPLPVAALSVAYKIAAPMLRL